LGKIIAGMTMSLDGFVADAEGNAGRLYPDFAELQGSPFMEEMIAETGSVLMGRRMFDMATPDSWAEYEFQAPIFVLTHHPPEAPPKQNARLSFTFVTDGVASAAAQAKAAAGDKAVQVVGGPGVIQELLRHGLVDELHIDIMPLLLGAGLRLFEDGDLSGVGLETLGVESVGQRANLRFRVAR
jgi:dihydrofolate reductase